MSKQAKEPTKPPKSDLVKNILTLITGTTIAQAFPLIAMPILTRLYSPQDFGVLALYVSVIAILSVLATAQYNPAVLLPDDDRDAASIVVLGTSIAIMLAAVLTAVVYFQGDNIVARLGMQKIQPYLYLIPITIAFLGLYQSLIAWAQRHKRFKQIATCTVVESATTALLPIVLHHPEQSGGQIYGNFIGKISASLVLLRFSLKADKTIFKTVTLDSVLANAKAYIKFPKYAIGSRLLGTTAYQLPILLISRFFGAATAGFFSLSFRVMTLPITFVSSSISRVIHPKIVDIHRDNPQDLSAFIWRSFLYLIVMISPLIAVMWFFGEPLFAFVFGEQWRPAGKLSIYLSIAVSAQFSVSPLSVVLSLEKNVQLAALWHAIYFVTMLTTLLLFRDASIEVFVQAFVVHELILYGLYFHLILKGCKHTPSGQTVTNEK